MAEAEMDGTPEGHENGTPGVGDELRQRKPLTAMDLENPKSQVDDDGKHRRTGTEWTASAHIITAVIGSGVLSVPWSIGQMGWVAGLVTLFLFALCTLYTSRLLADCYRHPDPVTGKRNYIYMDAVKVNLSRRSYLLCGLTQYSNLVGTSIGYTITTATAARAIQKTDCFHRTGGQGDCLASTTPYIAIYGVIQIVLSLIPNFGEIWWLSYVAATMSFTYSFIVLGLGIGHSASKQSKDFGSLGGIGIGLETPSTETEAQKVWNIFIALGNIAFAYSYSMILIEIQDTLRNPPSERKQMKRATVYGISATTFFYVTVGITGYTAFGNSIGPCGNILTCFENPYWLVNFANACVVIHLVGAYQVYTQPVYQFVEMSVEQRFPNSKFLKRGYLINLPGGMTFDLNLFRASWRTVYVIITTIISMVVPFFNDVLGILGSLGFWPLTVYFPLAMYIAQHKIQRFSRLWIGLQMLSFVTFLVSLAALIGSIEGIYIDLQHVKLFAAT
ncbi:unnamed protein product [Calypogeia fissa]